MAPASSTGPGWARGLNYTRHTPLRARLALFLAVFLPAADARSARGWVPFAILPAAGGLGVMGAWTQLCWNAPSTDWELGGWPRMPPAPKLVLARELNWLFSGGPVPAIGAAQEHPEGRW